MVLSGSLPAGVAHDLPARLAARCAQRGGRLVLDTSGEILLCAAAPPRPIFVLRMDEQEAEALAGGRLRTRGDTADLAEALVRRRAAQVVVVARGAEVSVMAKHDRRWFAKTPEVPVKSRVGAGDSFLAAVTLGLARGRTPKRSLPGQCGLSISP